MFEHKELLLGVGVRNGNLLFGSEVNCSCDPPKENRAGKNDECNASYGDTTLVKTTRAAALPLLRQQLRREIREA